MPKYKIAWLPGDGIGIEVLQAARLVLDRLRLDAEYLHGDIGWEFWQKEGDAFPQRTIDLLGNVHAAMFGAITSKPIKAAEAELVLELQGKNLVYRSPIVRMRQLFDLYNCFRPCKAYPGNSLNYKEGIDLVVFRENTEDLYAGVEFTPVPEELSLLLGRISKPFSAFQGLAAGACALPLSMPASFAGKKSRWFTRLMSCELPTAFSSRPRAWSAKTIPRFPWMMPILTR
jgi:isocitrate/isopropylmalate dehydrogenase